MKKAEDAKKPGGKPGPIGGSARENSWVWVVVQDPGGNERFVGLKDQERDIWFVPAFPSKEEAQQGLLEMPREKGIKYEVQAVLFGELSRQCVENGFMIFMVNAAGEVLEKISPV